MRKKILNVCLPALMLLASTVAWAQIPTVKVYQIGTAEELKAFADAVNNGENYAHGILTADIDYGTENTMIGRDGMDFQGCLDGQGHTITINMTGSADGQALCRNLGVNGRVQNLVIKGTITTAFKYAAAVAAWSGGTVTNVKSELTVNSSISGDGTHAGIVAVPGAGSLVANCMAIFTIDGPQTNNCGGIVGWASDRCIVENCLAINNFTLSGLDGSASISRNAGSMLKAYNNYYLNATGDGAGGTQVSAEDLASGKVCFLLNHDQRNIQWTQTIGTDPYPVPFTTQSTVYCSAATKCDGTSDDAGATYSNTATNAIATAHTLVGGACTTCKSLINGSAAQRSIPQGYVVPNYVARDENDIYLVKTADDMDWLSIIHAVGNESFNLKLMNDIDYTSRNEWLNQQNWYGGVVDGQGYTLKIALGAGNTTSIMPNFAGDIKNIVIEGTIDCGTKQFAAAVTSHTRNLGRTPSISNVASNVAITSAVEGDGTHGGLIGVNEVESRVSNSIFLGSITSTLTNNCGGLIGWCSSPCFISDAIQAGTISIASGDNNTIARNAGNLRMENVYYVTANGDTPGGITQITNTDDLKSGKITFELNKSNTTDPAWRQNLGTDLYPMPISSHAIVYAAPAEGFRCDGMPQGETSYTNEASASTIPPHTFADGFCQVCSTYDPDFLKPDADGFYQLKSGRDLAWFSHKVSDGKQGNLSAKLMNDINMTDEDNAVFVSIANSSDAAYSGTFDGQGHTISNLKVVRPTYAGLFGYATGGATIKNVTLDSSCTITSEGGFAGIIGGSTGGGTITMECLGNEGTVKAAAQNAGGIIGVNMGSAAAFIIRNCYVSGSVTGANESAAITGWTGGSQSLIENCWSTATISGNDDGKPFYRNDDTRVVNCYNLTGEQATKMTEEQLKSGELTYKLNGSSENPVWLQSLGKDATPTLNATHSVVYKVGDTAYSNIEGVPFADGVYQIGTAEALEAFAKAVNGGERSINAVLTADIPEYSGTAISLDGQANAYAGTFDGQFHTININLTSTGSNYGLFRGVAGTVKNLHVSGSFTAAHNRVGVICGEIFGGLIENCWVSADITATFSGDGAIAGICGRASGTNSLIKNCVFSGNVTSSNMNTYNCTGIVGWCPNVIDIQNCIVTGKFTIDLTQGNARPIARYDDTTNTNAKCVNCFYVDANGGRVQPGAEQVTEEQVKSGELCFKANGDQTTIIMYQTLAGENVDAVPVPFSNHAQVYAEGNINCGGVLVDGTVTYTNETQTLPDHTFLNGICQVCDKVDTEWVKPNEDGIYMLAQAEEMIWFAAMVNQGNKDINGQLTADIDLKGYEDKFVPVGTSTCHYTGTFDGQYHTINVNLIATEPSYGFFRYLDGTVKNLHISGTYEARFNKTGVIAGEVFGGLIENCWVSSDISAIYAGDAATAGIVGRGSATGSIIRNCVFSGTIDQKETTTWNCTSIMGWAGNPTTIENCLFSGKIIADDSQGNAYVIARNPTNLTIRNCYYVNVFGGVNDGATQITDEQVANGEVALLLGSNWRQNIGQDIVPTTDPSHGILTKIDAAGYATLYIPEESVIIPNGVTANTAIINEPWITTTPIQGNFITAGLPVVLQAAQGIYSFVPVAAVTDKPENDLKGTAEPLTATGIQYVLAEKDGVVGFYQAAEGTTIPAGKAYIEYAGASVKGFFFNNADGIADIETADDTNAVIYDLSGRRVEKAQKGIYIVNGKKVMK